MSSAFPRQLRLTSAEAFSRVFQKPSKSYSAWFVVLYRANDLGYPRLGFAISKKRVKKAVSRNQIKRLIRENFRLKQQQLGAWDIVVLARKRMDKIDAQQQQAIERHLQELLIQD